MLSEDIQLGKKGNLEYTLNILGVLLANFVRLHVQLMQLLSKVNQGQMGLEEQPSMILT